jgi:hypothetical protein
MSQFAADRGNLRDLVHQYGYMTTELYDIRAPKAFLNSEGRAGVFVGLSSSLVPREAKLSLDTVDIVNVKLLTLKEVEYAANGKAAAREQLAQLFMKQGNATASDVNRPSVV